MKKLTLLFALVVLGVVAASGVALATHTTEVNTQKATLSTGGSVIISGTITCQQGGSYSVYTILRQNSGGNEFNTGSSYTNGTCSTSGPTTWSTTVFGAGPFHQGRATVQTSGYSCDLTHCGSDQETKQMRIRRP
jgi:hypothetical protein